MTHYQTQKGRFAPLVKYVATNQTRKTRSLKALSAQATRFPTDSLRKQMLLDPNKTHTIFTVVDTTSVGDDKQDCVVSYWTYTYN